MSSQLKTYLTPEEYLAFERKAEYKNEYIDGEVYAMTGASRRRNLITVNIAVAQDECRVEQYVKQPDGRRLLSDHRSPGE
jgi:Uma2 family endonuclease